ncbi:MAG: ATP-binding protein [Caldilineaceae bacterium]
MEQTAIFRRFYRIQNTTNGGSGLGLVIVQSIVQAHGSRVAVESVVGQGSRFAFVLSEER